MKGSSSGVTVESSAARDRCRRACGAGLAAGSGTITTFIARDWSASQPRISRPRLPVAGRGIQWSMKAGVKRYPLIPVLSISSVSTPVGIVST